VPEPIPDLDPGVRTDIERVDLPLPGKKLAYVLYNVFTPEECQALIDFSEKRGYAAALINIGGGKQILMQDYRNNDRCIVDDDILTGVLYSRLSGHLPRRYHDRDAVGLNER
jgi:hypothetical protein